jgi:hypothetical protein
MKPIYERNSATSGRPFARPSRRDGYTVRCVKHFAPLSTVLSRWLALAVNGSWSGGATILRRSWSETQCSRA